MKKILSILLYIPTPSSISLMWNFGSLLGISMMIQIISGFFLSMHYCAHINMAFNSYIFISKILLNGFILQMFHVHFSSLIFIFIYMHILKSLLNKSFNIKYMWVTGNMMLFMTMGSAFLGYVLPWGQMSFWGATVITNILSSFPYVGSDIVMWIWGGFSVSNSTLNRFFSLHFILPLLIIMMSLFHLSILHKSGSSNQMGLFSSLDKIYFGKSFSFKDLVSMYLMMFIYFLLLLMFVDHHYSMAKENFYPADPLNTPLHIKPEWYFMFAYALLRSVPSKVGGILSLLMLFLLFFFLMFKSSYNSKFKFSKKLKVFFLLKSFFLLTLLGYKSIESPFIEISLVMGLFMMILLIII